MRKDVLASGRNSKHRRLTCRGSWQLADGSPDTGPSACQIDPGIIRLGRMCLAVHERTFQMTVPNSDGLRERLATTRFPRASSYDPHWLIDNWMGPHVLWLAEWLAERLDLRPGMRVLDLGCGRAVSSIFLTKEFGVSVWAVDLWIKPSQNTERIEQAGVSRQVFPILAEAHNLPFAEGYFDAIVSVDAYHYFGTDDLHLGYIATFLRPGGQLGIVTPCVLDELADLPPPHLSPYWVWDFCSFHSPAWWRRH